MKTRLEQIKQATLERRRQQHQHGGQESLVWCKNYSEPICAREFLPNLTKFLLLIESYLLQLEVCEFYDLVGRR